jgi:hypothetical protein|tara:strand:+ start:724 stop:933 length:210 start_codon:yes stop_codon:yes gene_type:complete
MKIRNKWDDEPFDVHKGDWVGFKSDIEQEGQIIGFRNGGLILQNLDGFCGDYIGGDAQTLVFFDEVWKL